MPITEHVHTHDRGTALQRAGPRTPPPVSTLQHAGPPADRLQSADFVHLQQAIGNHGVGRLLARASHGSPSWMRPPASGGSATIQRYEEELLPPKTPSSSFLFKQRVAEQDATTGTHNYAVVLGSWVWAKSTSNRHAEIKLLLGLRPREGETITIVSEFKPCAACKRDMEEFEQTHGVTIRVLYFIDYTGIGDGDKDKVRNFYKGLGMLSGGGDYVYQVV